MVSYPPPDQPSGMEWDGAYARELSVPKPSSEDSSEYYTTATWEQKKFLYALGAESMYWRMRNTNPGTPAQAAAEKEFLALLENASSEQRSAIELCINLTKAIQALMLATHPDTDGQSAQRAQAVYNQIVAERPDIRPILYYRLARIALMRSYSAGTPNPSPAYLSLISKLDEQACLAVFAMRAAFFDHVMNDQSASAALRASAAEHYSRLLLGRPGTEAYLQRFLHVRTGISLFLSKPNSSVLEDPRTHPHGWLQVLNEDEVTRNVLHYELAAIFFTPEHKALLKNPSEAEPPDSDSSPPSISPKPGPLAPKSRGGEPFAAGLGQGALPLAQASSSRAGRRSGTRRSGHAHRAKPSYRSSNSARHHNSKSSAGRGFGKRH